MIILEKSVPYLPILLVIFILAQVYQGYIENNEPFLEPDLYSDQLKDVFMPSSEEDINQEIAELYTKARNHNTTAMIALAEKYWMGDGVTKDRRRAFKMYKISAELGNTASEVWVGDRYAQDFSNFSGHWLTERDKYIHEAVYWLDRASQKNSSDAWLSLSYIYGDEETPSDLRDLVLSEKYLKMSVSAGNEHALRRFCDHGLPIYYDETDKEICEKKPTLSKSN
jgi:TPR repeat protein